MRGGQQELRAFSLFRVVAEDKTQRVRYIGSVGTTGENVASSEDAPSLGGSPRATQYKSIV